MSRLVISLAASAALAAAWPSWAAAENRLTIVQRGGLEPSHVSGDPHDPFNLPGRERLEVLRAGTPVGTPTQPYDWGAGVSLPELLAGDEAFYYQGDTLVVRHVYDGLPGVTGVCAGATSFRVVPGDLSMTRIATGVPGGGNDNPITASGADPGLMQVARPLAAGDYVEAGGYRMVGGVRVSQQTSLTVRDCPAPPVQSEPAPPATVKMRAHRIRQGLRVTVKLPEAGTVRVRVSAGGRTLATLRRAGDGTERLTLKLTRRQRARALTVTATLTPSAPGEPRSAKVMLPRDGR